MVKPELTHEDLIRVDHLDLLPGGDAGVAPQAHRLASEVSTVREAEAGDSEVPERSDFRYQLRGQSMKSNLSITRWLASHPFLIFLSLISTLSDWLMISGQFMTRSMP